MSLAYLGRYVGNKLYDTAFPVYRPLYRDYKSYVDRAERELLARHLSPEAVVVDAGANIGIYTQFLSRCVGPRVKIHSFEPSPANFARLTEALSHFSNVRLNQLAVGDRSGDVLLYISENLNVDHRVYATEGVARKTLTVRSIRLDDYFPPGARVDLIKMDIQGYEFHALCGAERVLADNPKVALLFEFWPFGLAKSGASAQSLLRFLHSRGFSTFLPEKNGLVDCQNPLVDSNNPAKYLNLFAKR
jgi:FkbM family methyltransferase